jgi:hypothetical protein
VVGLDDVGVDEVGHQPGFADEVLLKLLDARILLPNELDGYQFAKVPCAVLEGLIHEAHAALGNLPQQLVMKFVEN